MTSSISYDKNLLMEIKFYLLEQELNENYFLMSGDEYFEQGFIDSGNEINSILEEMYTYQENDELTVPEALVDEMAFLQEKHIDIFNALVDKVGGNGLEQVDYFQYVADDMKSEMVEILDNELAATRYDLQQAAAQHDTNVLQAILVGVMCLILLPLLAVWIIDHAGKQISSLLNLTNTVVDRKCFMLNWKVWNEKSGISRMKIYQRMNKPYCGCQISWRS